MKRLFKFLSENSSSVLAIATLALVVITGLYLSETRLMRKIAYKSFLAEVSPKVFLETPTSVIRLNSPKKEIEVTAVFNIKNVGKTEAKNFVATYTISSGKEQNEGKIGPVPYLFPTQSVPYETKMLRVRLNEEQLAVAKEAMDMKKTLIVPKGFAPPIFLDFNLRYLDQEGKEQNLPYRYKYIFHTNAWVSVTE